VGDRRPYLQRCDLSQCEGICCYDGVYLEPGEDRRLRALVKENPDFFRFLPKVYLLTGQGGGGGVKTATRPHVYRQKPEHFTATRCVFALPDARCALQVLAVEQGLHPWTHKPRACWLHPLRVNATGAIPPPATEADDPDCSPGYPGYTAFTPCGADREEGVPWEELLREEVEFLADWFRAEAG
jgi:Protein of unknown function (DUF3109)